MKIQALFAQKEKIEGPEISYKHKKFCETVIPIYKLHQSYNI